MAHYTSLTALSDLLEYFQVFFFFLLLNVICCLGSLGALISLERQIV